MATQIIHINHVCMLYQNLQQSAQHCFLLCGKTYMHSEHQIMSQFLFFVLSYGSRQPPIPTLIIRYRNRYHSAPQNPHTTPRFRRQLNQTEMT